MVWLLWKTLWLSFKNLNVELTYGLAISLLSIYLKELKAGFQGYVCISVCIAALITTAKKWKQLICVSLTGECTNNAVYTYNRISFSLKKKGDFYTSHNMNKA